MSGDWAAAAVVASVAIGFTIYHTATAWFTHKERLAKIQKGIDPDHPAQQ
jgi:hypothetical protein